MKKCTPMGYVLHEVAFVASVGGILLIFISGATIVWELIQNAFSFRLLWLFLLSITVWLFSQFLYSCSSKLADKKGFAYDYEKDEASWTERGERTVYKRHP